MSWKLGQKTDVIRKKRGGEQWGVSFNQDKCMDQIKYRQQGKSTVAFGMSSTKHQEQHEEKHQKQLQSSDKCK